MFVHHFSRDAIMLLKAYLAYHLIAHPALEYKSIQKLLKSNRNIWQKNHR